MKPLIFITNDDGIQAPGINRLIQTVKKWGDILVVAPENPQSGMSHAITMDVPLHLKKRTEEPGCTVYACSGTPVDCVKLAFDKLLPRRPDLMLSGINHGSNSAISLVYSGTMGAAIEASYYDVPAVGLSLLDHELSADFDAAAHFSEIVIKQILAQKVETPFCLNVNIPKLPQNQIKGIKICRQNKGMWLENFDRRTDPRGRHYYWLTGAFNNLEQEASDTDEWALANGYVSIVPVQQADFTHYGQLDLLKSWDF